MRITKIWPEFLGKSTLGKDEKYEIFKEKAEPLAAKLGIPIIYFNGQSDVADYRAKLAT